MAEEIVDKCASVDSICITTQDNDSIAHNDNTQAASNAEFSSEELYKHALQFYKGRLVLCGAVCRNHVIGCKKMKIVLGLGLGLRLGLGLVMQLYCATFR